MDNNKPTIGVALSGSGSRLVFYIGFLEALDEAGIKVDYIAACSGGSVVAAAYACGQMQELKNTIFTLDKKTFFSYLKRGKGGLYNLDKIEEQFRTFTNGLRFEDVKPLMGFVAADLESGKQVVMSMGDIARAARISCSLPALCEPVRWGGMTLIDGGLLSIIPVDVVKDAGMDITIGINMRGTKHLFTNRQIALKKIFNIFKKAFLIDYLEKALDAILPDPDDYDLEEKPGMLKILNKSMDIAIEANKKDYSKILECDLMISPNITKFRLKNIEKLNQQLLELGRKTAQDNIPKILELTEKKKKATQVPIKQQT